MLNKYVKFYLSFGRPGGLMQTVEPVGVERWYQDKCVASSSARQTGYFLVREGTELALSNIWEMWKTS